MQHKFNLKTWGVPECRTILHITKIKTIPCQFDTMKITNPWSVKCLQKITSQISCDKSDSVQFVLDIFFIFWKQTLEKHVPQYLPVISGILGEFDLIRNWLKVISELALHCGSEKSF